MRKRIYFANVSLDGFIAAADGNDDWIRIDAELRRFINAKEREIGGYLYRRRMYE